MFRDEREHTKADDGLVEWISLLGMIADTDRAAYERLVRKAKTLLEQTVSEELSVQ